MEIRELKIRANIAQNKKLNATFEQYQDVITALKKVELPDSVVTAINAEIDSLNASVFTEKSLRRLLSASQSKILERVEVDLKLVTKGHYRNLWLVLGMAAFGVPFGVVFGMMVDNMAFLGLGISVGLPIGLAVGAYLDKKAFQEGRQLDVELKF